MKRLPSAVIAVFFTIIFTPQAAQAIQGCSVDLYTAQQMKPLSDKGYYNFAKEPETTIEAGLGERFGSKRIKRSQTCRLCEREGISIAVKECRRGKGRYFGYEIKCVKNRGTSKKTGKGFGLYKRTGRECP